MKPKRGAGRPPNVEGEVAERSLFTLSSHGRAALDELVARGDYPSRSAAVNGLAIAAARRVGGAREAIVAGDRFDDAEGGFRVMAVVDRWVMARRPRAVPFVVYLSDLVDRIERGEVRRAKGT